MIATHNDDAAVSSSNANCQSNRVFGGAEVCTMSF